MDVGSQGEPANEPAQPVKRPRGGRHGRGRGPATQACVLSPVVEHCAACTQFMRVAVGTGYRLALTDTMNKVLSSDLNGWLARAMVELGQF